MTLYGMAQSMSSVIQRFSNTFHHIKRNLFDMGRMKYFMETAPVSEEKEKTEEVEADCPIVFEARIFVFLMTISGKYFTI